MDKKIIEILKNEEQRQKNNIELICFEIKY